MPYTFSDYHLYTFFQIWNKLDVFFELTPEKLPIGKLEWKLENFPSTSSLKEWFDFDQNIA